MPPRELDKTAGERARGRCAGSGWLPSRHHTAFVMRPILVHATTRVRYVRRPMASRSDEPHHRYADAIEYMIRKHGVQQRRDGSPYFVHPIRVAEILRGIGGVDDMDVVIAAVLHDLIEDTECEWANLEQRFGKRVADLVAILTGDMRLPKPARRQEIVERIRAADTDAKAVRLADRLDNVTDMNGFSQTRKREYIEESKLILEACRGANAALERALSIAIGNGSEEG
jgi:guanosine-3',5'-bis(diphosphate) 3'-pyrophosphohydrolase